MTIRLFLASFLLSAGALAQAPGWVRYEHGADGYSYRYLPPSLVGESNIPLVVFLHGHQGKPENYQSFLEDAADLAEVALVVPAAVHSEGWVLGLDEPSVDAAVAAARAELSVDPRRIAWAGHSSGGAYAIQLAYLTRRRISAVFTLAAPFRTIGAVDDPLWTAPLRMYYGTLDPNYVASLPLYESQWEQLELAYELEVMPGVGHNTLLSPVLVRGFRFLAAHSYPGGPCEVETPQAICLLGGRYRVELDWRTASGGTGIGREVAPGLSVDSTLLYFFAPSNWEMLVKVLDGCALSGHRWVFAAAATNVEWTLTVTDAVTGIHRSWTNPQGVRSPALTDTGAFPCDVAGD